MLLAVLGVVLGLAALTYAADQFVVGAARLAAVLRLSTVVIGAVVIGFGTSAPELVVSALASAQGSLDIAVGNIVGSNVANLTLVLGVAALATPIVVHSKVLKREAPISLLSVIAFAILVQGGLSHVEGTILAVLLVVSLALIVIILASRRDAEDELGAEVAEFLDDQPPSTGKESLRTLLGLIGTLAAAQLLVLSATTIAEELGLSQGFIGLTVVAVGTSLPELATAVQAARKDETDLIVGNLLGSNLFNSAAVGATAAFAGAGQVADVTITGRGVTLMVTVAVVATAFMITGRQVQRLEGALLLAAYVVTVPLLAG
jgi:cation:H+ antiporter